MREKSSRREYCTWEEVELLIKILANKIRNSKKKYNIILGITNGGIIPARMLARDLDMNHILFIPVRNKKLYMNEMPQLSRDKKYLIVDEIYDTGSTLTTVYDTVRNYDCDFAFLMKRFMGNNVDGREYIAKILNHNKWVVFPWERKIIT